MFRIVLLNIGGTFFNNMLYDCFGKKLTGSSAQEIHGTEAVFFRYISGKSE